MIKILVADEFDLVFHGLQDLFKEISAFEVCEFAGCGSEVIEKVKQNPVDIILLDVSLPEMDGIETTREVRKLFPEQKLIAHSALNSIEYINSMLIEGASGYILKGSSLTDYEEGITSVNNGRRYISPAAKETIGEGYTHTYKNIDGEYIGLTKREKQVIRLVAAGKSNQEIADTLFLNIETIRSHRKSLMTKLDIKNTAGLIKYAIDRRWV